MFLLWCKSICISCKSCEHLFHDILILVKFSMVIILLFPRWRLFVDCTQYLRPSCLMMVDDALGMGWDKGICCNHSLLLSLWKFSFCCGQPANPNRPLACGGDLEVRETLECFSFPLLIDSSNLNGYLSVCWTCLLLIDLMGERNH